MGRLLRKPQSRDLLLGAMLVLAALALAGAGIVIFRRRKRDA